MLLFVYLHPEPPYYPRQTLPPFGKRRLPLVSILIGEICYNLRSALDYLVYELAILDSSKRQDGTQFPIDDTPEKFSKHKRSWLKGLNSNHVAAIEKLQPYNGADWARILRDLSNPDKHRLLTATGYTATTELVYGHFQPSFTPDISVKRRIKRLDGTAMEVELIATVPIDIGVKNSAGDIVSQPAVKTLENLIPKVRSALTDFKTEFLISASPTVTR